MGDDPDRELLDRQIRYYRARAAQYDRTSSIEGDPFAADTRIVRAALSAFAPRGRVLEHRLANLDWEASVTAAGPFDWGCTTPREA
jgi:hypothetical protein